MIFLRWRLFNSCTCLTHTIKLVRIFWHISSLIFVHFLFDVYQKHINVQRLWSLKGRLQMPSEKEIVWVQIITVGGTRLSTKVKSLNLISNIQTLHYLNFIWKKLRSFLNMPRANLLRILVSQEEYLVFSSRMLENISQRILVSLALTWLKVNCLNSICTTDSFGQNLCIAV